MAGGKCPPPPLSPHEEGENSNSRPLISQPQRQPLEKVSKMVIISSNIPSSSNGNTPNPSFSNKPTYSEVVKGPSANQTLPHPLRPTEPVLSEVTLMPISEFQGKPSVIFPISEKKLLVDKLQFVLIGKFTHGRPTWTTILQFFNKLKLSGIYSVSNYDKKHIFIECSNKFDYYRIWMNLTWFIGDYAMRVFKWTSNFSPLVEAPIVPVWVRFEGLPLYMFDVLPLLSVSNCIGKPIRVDPRNVSRTIVNSARVCVELDISQPLVEEVWITFEDEQTKKPIEGFLVKVFYDVAPPYCDFCFHIGHGMQSCKRRSDMVIMGDKMPENSRQLHRPDTVCDQDGTAKPMCAPDLSVELVKTDQEFTGQGEAGQVSAVVIRNGEGELVGKKKDFKQLEGMLANKKLQSASTASSSRTTAYPKAQKLIQKQKKVYQVKKQPQLSSKALEITKNSFAILEEEVLIEDLPLEEGELVVADVCVPSAISSPLVHDATTVTDSDVRSAGNAVKIVDSPVAGETGPGLSIARDLSIGKESKRVEAGSQELADGKVVAVQKISAGVSVTSGKTAAAGAGAAGHALAGVNRTELQEHTSAGNARTCRSMHDRHAIATAWEGAAGAATGDHGAGDSDVAGASAAQVLQQFEMQNMGKSELNLQGTIDRVGEPAAGGFDVNKQELAAGNVANKSITAPRVLSAEAVEFSPSTVAKNTKVGGHSWADLVTTNAMDQLQERMNRLKGDSFPAAPSLAASSWVPPNMSKHLARELKKFRKHRITQNWQEMEDVSDEESEEGDLDEKVGSQMLKGGKILSDDMSDIPRPFKIKSAPNSPKGRNNTYDSNTYLLSRGLS